MGIKFSGKAKYSKERIAPSHPHEVNVVRWHIEGEDLTTEEIIARCEGIPAKTVRSRLHTGVRKWNLLSKSGTTTLKRINIARRQNSFDSLRENSVAYKTAGISAHQHLK